MINKKKFQFRFAKPADIKTIVEINIGEEEDYREIDQKMFSKLVRNKLVLVASENKKIVGLLYWRPDFLGRFDHWYLKQVTICKEMRNRGVATQLLGYFLRLAKKNGIEKIFGDIQNDNYPSLNMCFKVGALISGTIEGIGVTDKKDERVIIRFELRSKRIIDEG